MTHLLLPSQLVFSINVLIKLIGSFKKQFEFIDDELKFLQQPNKLFINNNGSKYKVKKYIYHDNIDKINLNNINWSLVSMYKYLPDWFIRKYIDYLNVNFLVEKQ